jgi:glycosyltransferase involved in cell wall biosynthesis
VKVAYHSPLPPERSGIADYSALLLPELERRIEVVRARRGKRSPRADVALYHVGNDPEAHGWIIEALRARPGVVVLHEHVLHHLVAGTTIARGDLHGYLDAMERDSGLVGRLLAHGVLDNRIPPLWETRPDDFPLNGEILDLATLLVVHSRYVEREVRARGHDGPLRRIPHPAWPVPELEPARVEGDFVVGCFGNVNASKRVPQLVEAFRRLGGGARLVLVGSLADRYPEGERLEAAVRDDPAVHREHYVDERRLWELMAACDVVVSLRAPTMGETSGTALRALSLGKPLVASELGWFAELPGEVALKVSVDEHEVESLEAALRLVRDEPAVRARMSAAALELARREHGVERVAELYVAAIEEAAGGDAVRDAVLGEVSQAAAEVGLADTEEVARRLSEAGLGN